MSALYDSAKNNIAGWRSWKSGGHQVFLIFTLKEFPFIILLCSLLPNQEADYLWTAVTNIWFSWNFLLFPPHTHTIGFLGCLQSVICLSSLIMWLAEASVLPSHHLEGTRSYATCSSRAGCVRTTGRRWDTGGRPARLGKGPKLSISKGTAQKPERPRPRCCGFPLPD